jgi:Rieske 2Fe-2S family protein
MSQGAIQPQFNGLTELVPGLPAAYYFDPERYVREMSRIWYRNWIYVCRTTDLANPKDFHRFDVGDQKILLVRDDQGTLRGFHNTCRHRGAALCREPSGRLTSLNIVCPYHAWVYNLNGELLRTSSKTQPDGFQHRDFSLYPIAVHEWSGFIFIALCDQPPPFERLFDVPIDRMRDWPLADLKVGHVMTKNIACNWKIFWENYNECLHCPNVHPQLSQLVPIFGRGLLEERDDPLWATRADHDPKFKGGLRRGAATWSMNGRTTGTSFPDVTDQDRQLGAVYMTALPSMFMVGHPDYVRVVRLRPLAPEQTELRVEYLFAAQTLANPQFDLHNIVDFTNRVMNEDADVCELNQEGLHALAHAQGVVMPEEYVIRELHEWLEREMVRS